MPKQIVKWGIDPEIADPDSEQYNPSDVDFDLAKFMFDRRSQITAMASQNISVSEGDMVQIRDIQKGVICFLNCSGNLDEITITTQSAENVSDAQQMAIYSTHSIGNVIWQGIPIQNAPNSLAETDYFSFRFRQAGNHYIRTVSP